MAGVEGDVAEAISSPVTGEGGNATEPSSESAEGGRDVTAPAFAPTQMIDARGEFSGSMDDFASDLGGEGDMEDGLVISALGVRGSGKSSLLNAVFNTGFDVGKAFVPSKGTKGAWVEVSGVGSKPIVVMDTQGCDGRGAEMDRVNRIATFALCFSDALIFNLWCADVGRYEAAGYGLLRTIFHEYLRLFHEELRSTLILFVIRDHDDGSSLDSLKTVLLTDLENIWDQVSKPSGCADLPVETFFNFEFVSLPHMRHRREEFDEGVAKIRRSLTDPSSSDYLLKSDYSKMVPLGAFGTYLDITWKDLGKDGDLEQPSRRDLVAGYRCDVAFHAQHNQALKQINRWSKEVDGGKLVSKFGKEASKMLDDRMTEYEAATSMHANAPVRARKETELRQFLQNNIISLFQKQILVLQSQSMQKFKQVLLDNVSNGASSSANVAMGGVVNWFSSEAENLVVPEMLLSFHQSKTVLQTVLQEYAQRFENSPAVQLAAMQRYERRAQRPMRREPDARVSLNLTGAMRPPGYGNFQLVTGYSDGPLAMNFSVCNDANAAEQEGHGKVPFFKFQPTLNYELDL